MPFSDKNKAKIMRNFEYIVKQLWLNRILDALISKDVLSLDDLQRIKSKPTQQDMTREFIQILLQCSDKGYDAFIEELRKDKAYTDLADQIEKTVVDIQ